MASKTSQTINVVTNDKFNMKRKLTIVAIAYILFNVTLIYLRDNGLSINGAILIIAVIGLIGCLGCYLHNRKTKNNKTHHTK